MNNTIRVIVWGVLALIFLGLGIFGMVEYLVDTTVTNKEEEVLVNIVEKYNALEYVNDLKRSNILTNASLKRNKISISYSDESVEEEYEYTYKKGDLLITISTVDENAWFVTKLLVDSISVIEGNTEGDTYDIFDHIRESKISNDEAFTIAVGEAETDIRINTKNALTIINVDELISYKELEENINDIINFDYSYTENNIMLNLYKDGKAKVIKLTQLSRLDEKSYNLILKVLSLILSKAEYNSFVNEYPELSDQEVVSFQNYIIEKRREGEIFTLTININQIYDSELDEIIQNQ